MRSGSRSPLHEAAYRQNVDVARLLIEHGADVNAKMTDGHTPLDTSEGRAIPIFLRRHGGISDGALQELHDGNDVS